MVQRIKCRHRQHHGRGRAPRQRQPQNPQHQAHLADGGIGQHRLGLGLCDADQGCREQPGKAKHGKHQPGSGQCGAERQEGKQTENPRLHDRP